MLATNFGNLCKMVTKFGSQCLATKFCTRLVTTIWTQDFTFCKEDCQWDTHWYQRNYLLSLLYLMWLMTSNRQLWYISLIMINTINVYIHHIASRETDLMISVQYTSDIWVKRITRFTSFLPRKLKPIAVAVTIVFHTFSSYPDSL